ncbi:MAG: hypothetical protein KVP17_003329 [Porospora cf. gigantea B]|uniref:uncharacterized protein n=1 Tax=Porospora cf. gigantea B TaxID=2853592 RepID=UPI003571ACBC|nr:MAG: hypothetical protein KVP17_003329 [Porospora cf. gigantea B]
MTTKDPSICNVETAASTPESRQRASSLYSGTRGSGRVGLLEIVCNVIGTVGFVVGSVFFCLEWSVPGCLIFAAACLFCGLSCCIYCHRARQVQNHVTSFGFGEQALGCFIFVIASIFFIIPELVLWGTIGFLVASLNFMDGTLIQHVVARSVFRPMCSLWPHTALVCPSMLCNTLGSVTFCLGSVCFFFDNLNLAGSILYTIGSIIFFMASWSDASSWYEDLIGFERKPGYA